MHPSFFGVDGMDGILSLENFDKSLAEGVMLLTPFTADATDELTKNFVTKYQESTAVFQISLLPICMTVFMQFIMPVSIRV